MLTEPIEETYFRWLCAKVVRADTPRTPSLNYWKLLQILHNTEFIWCVPNDDNRVSDGIELRRFFLRETNIKSSEEHWLSEGCSILEMLIAFAYRAEFTTDIHYSEWFWKFIENLGLSQFNDASIKKTDEIANILEMFVWRTYSPNGEGGLFPIEHPHRDQRDVEIWYQFCDYLVEENQ